MGRRATGRNMGNLNWDTDASPQARQARRAAEGTAAPWLPVLHGGGCWCGALFGHDWPGKAAGAPHPRDWPGRVNGHPYRDAEVR
jgi:hypothetical protein